MGLGMDTRAVVAVVVDEDGVVVGLMGITIGSSTSSTSSPSVRWCVFSSTWAAAAEAIEG